MRNDATDGLWLAFLLDGRGGARELDWDGVERWRSDHGALWIHLDPSVPRAMEWLRERSGLSESEVADLQREEPRPRIEQFEHGGVLMSLRGLAPDLEKDTRDLTSITLWAKPDRLISLCARELPGVAEARARAARKRAPLDLEALLVSMAGWLGGSLQLYALDLESPLAELEYAAELGTRDTSQQLREIKARVTRLRRNVAPFRILLRRTLELEDSWVLRGKSKEWRSLADQAQDTDALLQSLYERLNAIHDYVGERLARDMNYILYLLTIFSTILLPLTFITGLFGMNIGIRGASYRFMDSTFAFTLVTIVLAGLAVFEYRFLRKRHFLPGKRERALELVEPLPEPVQSRDLRAIQRNPT